MTSAPAFGVLGATRVTLAGQPVALRSARQRRLLATLLLDRGSVVSVDRLIDAVWGDARPADPRGALHNQMARVRALLGPCIETADGGYRLVAPDDNIDAAAFGLAIEAARAPAPPRQRAERLRDALALWRGHPYEDLDTDGARAEASRLCELRLAAEEELGAVLLQAGAPDEAVALLEPFCAAEPLRERGRLELARALVQVGRQADALRTLDDLRRELATQLGIEPSAAVAALVSSILDGDRARPTALVSPPRPLAAIYGREGDVDAVAALTRHARAISLVGPGGVGKTTLALLVAAQLTPEFAHGVAYVDLAGATTEFDLPAAFARALGVDERPGDEGSERLVEVLLGRRTLLLVDNAEHVIGATAELLWRVLSRTDAVTALVTSREPLQISGERVWPVAPLPAEGVDAPAVALFRDRATAVRPGWAPSDAELDVVAGICRRLDGLPLAIELAAAQLRWRSTAEIAAQLDHPFDLLDRGAPRRGRHEGLRAMVDWSYHLLSEREQAVFDRLGVFAGGFLADTARRVCADISVPDDLDAALVALVERSLVQVEDRRYGSRYRLLETLRHYALSHLDDEVEERTRDRHARAVVDLVVRTAGVMRGPQEAQWVALLDDERADLVVAHRRLLERGELDHALRLWTSAHLYAYVQARFDVLDLAVDVVAVAEGSGVEPARDLLALALGVAAERALTLGDFATAAERVARGMEVAGAVEPGADRICLGVAGDLALFQGDPAKAAEHYAASAEGFTRAGDDVMVATLTGARALAVVYGGDRHAATVLATGAAELARASGCVSAIAFTHYVHGEVVVGTDPEQASRHFHEALRLALEVNASWIGGIAHLSLATLLARSKDPADALPHYEALIDLWRRAGNWTQQWNTLRTLVLLLADLGLARDALALLAGIDANAAAPRWGEDDARLTAFEASARSALGNDFEPVRAEGAARSGPEVLATAEAMLARVRPS